MPSNKRRTRASGGVVVSSGDLDIADRIHSAAIHILRRVRVEDRSSGLSPPKLSALSVVVFGGPIAVGDLAAAEQVRAPTISRLVKDLEREGLVSRQRDRQDSRIQRIQATAKGRELLQRGRQRRVAHLAMEVARLTHAERRVAAKAANILELLALPTAHPRHRK